MKINIFSFSTAQRREECKHKHAPRTQQAKQTFVNVQSESPDGDSNHALLVVKKLDGLSVQRKVIQVLSQKKNKVWMPSVTHRASSIPHKVGWEKKMATLPHWRRNELCSCWAWGRGSLRKRRSRPWFPHWRSHNGGRWFDWHSCWTEDSLRWENIKHTPTIRKRKGGRAHKWTSLSWCSQRGCWESAEAVPWWSGSFFAPVSSRSMSGGSSQRRN